MKNGNGKGGLQRSFAKIWSKDIGLSHRAARALKDVDPSELVQRETRLREFEGNLVRRLAIIAAKEEDLAQMTAAETAVARWTYFPKGATIYLGGPRPKIYGPKWIAYDRHDRPIAVRRDDPHLSLGSLLVTLGRNGALALLGVLRHAGQTGLEAMRRSVPPGGFDRLTLDKLVEAGLVTCELAVVPTEPGRVRTPGDGLYSLTASGRDLMLWLSRMPLDFGRPLEGEE